MNPSDDAEKLSAFLAGKPAYALLLFDHFFSEFQKIGPITLHTAKTMIGIANSHKKIAYLCQFGKNFIHVVFLFKERYDDNTCFQKIVYMPGMFSAVTHHLRIYYPEDVNDEVRAFMRLAFES